VDRLRAMFDELDTDKKGEIELKLFQQDADQVGSLVGLCCDTPASHDKAHYDDVKRYCTSLESKGWSKLTFGEFKLFAQRSIEVFEHGLSEQECKEMKGFVDKDLNGIDDRYQLGPVGSNTSSPPHISTAAALLSSAQPLSTPAATHAPTASGGEADANTVALLGLLGDGKVVNCSKLVQEFKQVDASIAEQLRLGDFLQALLELDLEVADTLEADGLEFLLTRTVQLSTRQQQEPQLQEIFNSLVGGDVSAESEIRADKLKKSGFSKLTATLGMKSAMKLRPIANALDRFAVEPGTCFDFAEFSSLALIGKTI